MPKDTPAFGGEGAIAQPPYQPEQIYTRIATMKLEDMQYEMRQMKIWIRKASQILEDYSLKLPDDDGLAVFRLAQKGKSLIEKK